MPLWDYDYLGAPGMGARKTREPCYLASKGVSQSLIEQRPSNSRFHVSHSLNYSRSLRQVPGVRVVAWVYHIGRGSKSLAGAVFRPLQAYLRGPGMRQFFYEKNLDFSRGHLNILAGLRASTHTVLDAWQESKSWFCHRKTLIFVQCF